MPRYAIVDTTTSLVVNVVEWDGRKTWKPPTGHKAYISGSAGPGDTYNIVDGTYTKAPIPLLPETPIDEARTRLRALDKDSLTETMRDILTLLVD